MPTVLNYTASNFSAVYVGFTHIARTRRDNNAFAFFFGAFILAIGSLLIAAPAQAVCPTIVNGETVTNDKQTLLVGQSCTVEKGGKIENDLNSVDPGFLGDGISGNGSNTIINKGKITVEGDNAAGIIVEDDSTVINEGTITASGAGAFAIFIPDDSTVICVNSGRSLVNGHAKAYIGTTPHNLQALGCWNTLVTLTLIVGDTITKLRVRRYMCARDIAIIRIWTALDRLISGVS